VCLWRVRVAAFGPLRSFVGWSALALARVAAGAARRGLILERSGAERADCPVVLPHGSGRRTHYAPCGRFVRTTAARMMTKCAARTDPCGPLLGAPEIAPAGLRLPRRWAFGVRYSGPGPRLPQTRSLAAKACGDSVRRASVALRSTGLAPSAQRVREHAHRGCLSGESEANAASSAMRAQDRAPQGSLRVQRQTATVKRRALSPRAFAAPPPQLGARQCEREHAPVGHPRTSAMGRKRIVNSPRSGRWRPNPGRQLRRRLAPA
jgi:hypothetical protein